MYNTSQKWKDTIYKNIQSVLNIYIDNELINPDYILDFKVGQTLFDDEELKLGSVSSKYIEFKIYKDKMPENMNTVKVDYGILINNGLTVAEVNKMLVGTLNGIQVKSLSGSNTSFEMLSIGIFNIDDWTDNDDNTLTIKCIDNMNKFEFNYDGSTLTYPSTLIEILEDICSKAGVELGSTSFLNSDIQVSTYDNTVTAREYLSYISECAGGFAFIGRDGKLYIRTIYQDEQEISLELFGEYKWGDKCTISKVSYENGVESFKFGNDTNNNLWINQDNMYIVNEDEVENIYNQVKGLEAYSFEGKVIIDPALDVGDKIIIDNKPVIYQGELDFQTRFIAEISSKIAIKEKQETTVKTTSQKVINRRVQSRIDEAEGKITQLIEENTETSNKLTQVEQTVDGINQKVELIEDFTREKTQVENLYIDDIAEGEGYVLKFIIYGNTKLFTSKEITICVSTNPRGYGEAVYLLTENEQELLTENGQQFTIGEASFFVETLKINLDNILRNLIVDSIEYCDTLEIEQDGTINVVRRIGVNSDGSLYLLSEEQITTLEEKIILPSIKDGVYYFIQELQGLKYYINYIVENDYSDTFLTKLELGTYITQNAEAIRVAWNQISQYLQMEGINGNATLNVYNEDNKMLMSLSQDGMTFFDGSENTLGSIGIVREENKDTLAFFMPVDWNNVDNSRNMAWGVLDPNEKFLPIFYLSGYYGEENSEYGGELEVVGNLIVNEAIEANKGIKLNELSKLAFDDCYEIYVTNQLLGEEIIPWLTIKGRYGVEFYCNNNFIFSITQDGINTGKDIHSVVNGYGCYPVLAIDDHKIYMMATDNNLYFMLDNISSSYFIAMGAGSYSDRRLKNEIKTIDEKFIKAIEKIDIKQFKLENRKGKISFGIIAQDLIEVFKEEGIDYKDYDIIQNLLLKINDETEYFAIDYNQFSVLKQLAVDKKIEKQQKEIDELKELVSRQQEQINKLVESTK